MHSLTFIPSIMLPRHPLYLTLIFLFSPSKVMGLLIRYFAIDHCIRIQKAPSLDGKLNEAEWSLRRSTTGFIQFRPNEGKPFTQITEVKIL
ncbi:MAG: hypothetical protein IPK10_18535 [Bacteroidetes bacterium]|nr:hypothetical protein [Bacteroidota bacterium]